MTFLVDTCVAIWFFEGSDAIPQKTLGRLVDAGNDVLLSDVSILEIVIKHSIGRLPLPQPPSALVPALARKHRFDILPLSTEDIFRLESLRPSPRGPGSGERPDARLARSPRPAVQGALPLELKRLLARRLSIPRHYPDCPTGSNQRGLNGYTVCPAYFD